MLFNFVVEGESSVDKLKQTFLLRIRVNRRENTINYNIWYQSGCVVCKFTLKTYNSDG